MSDKRVKKKTAQVLVKMTPEDKAEIELRAQERNLTVTDYLTRTGLARATRQRADVDAINMLRECRDQLKEIYRAVKARPVGEGTISDPTMEAHMAAITGAVLRVWNGSSDE
jgi:hypothetical protein